MLTIQVLETIATVIQKAVLLVLLWLVVVAVMKAAAVGAVIQVVPPDAVSAQSVRCSKHTHTDAVCLINSLYVPLLKPASRNVGGKTLVRTYVRLGSRTGMMLGANKAIVGPRNPVH